ncbi:putative acetyltransferase [Promicromonospora sp. AC04]|uniref:GNAT family N-acetyltransferase n=1 Tax=Promicromonospora sp. AC04 TaxID=2135723 RepID=UPI000D3906CD|nr:N-acetyltransferase [Promicromonospora sp. AC04]PUB24542.1 putative acetyltransferase [Promicromonospora sp. AC04]
MSEWVIRPERPADFPAIRTVLVAAFGEDRVADGVDRIRESWIYRPGTSLVAVSEAGVSDREVVGCVMVTGCTVTGDAGERTAAMLTPLAVSPDHQRRGIGASLVRAALAGAEQAGEPFVVLEGSPDYYGALGFAPAREHGIEMHLPDGVPHEAAQVHLLPAYDPADPGLRGDITYPPVYG